MREHVLGCDYTMPRYTPDVYFDMLSPYQDYEHAIDVGTLATWEWVPCFAKKYPNHSTQSRCQ